MVGMLIVNHLGTSLKLFTSLVVFLQLCSSIFYIPNGHSVAWHMYAVRTYFFTHKDGHSNLFIYFRDAIVYATSTFTEGLETVMNILSDGIFKQTVDDEIVRKTARHNLSFASLFRQIDDLQCAPKKYAF